VLDIALASCRVLPDPDPDEAPLLSALRAAGFSAQTLAWDDPKSDFASARATVLRATWNYPERPADFLAWVDRTAAGAARLFNGADVVRWNHHKGYLLELERRGVPIVPSRLVERGETTPLAEIARASKWVDVVVKPAIGGGSRGTLRVSQGAMARDDAHLRVLVDRGDALVQPYMASVEEYGERAIVWIDGELTHAVRKSRRFLGDRERVSASVPIAPDEAELARAAVAVAAQRQRDGGALLYARVDVVRDDHGAPRVMELEVIEPSLFFAQSEEALRRYVSALTVRLQT
jgi:glutathione synthase/RimK-type ligase-like ATP-grasp enzyme